MNLLKNLIEIGTKMYARFVEIPRMKQYERGEEYIALYKQSLGMRMNQVEKYLVEEITLDKKELDQRTKELQKILEILNKEVSEDLIREKQMENFPI